MKFYNSTHIYTMKLNKAYLSLFLCTACLLFLGSCSKKTTATAESPQNTEVKTENRSPRGQGQRQSDDRFLAMAKEIGLNASQTSKFVDISQEFVEQRRSMQRNGDRSAMRAAMEKMRDENNLKMKAIMDAKQYTKYLSIMQNSRPGNGGGARPNRRQPGIGG